MKCKVADIRPYMAIPSTSISLSLLYINLNPLSGMGHSPLPTSTVNAGAPYFSINQSFNPADPADLSGSQSE